MISILNNLNSKFKNLFVSNDLNPPRGNFTLTKKIIICFEINQIQFELFSREHNVSLFNAIRQLFAPLKKTTKKCPKICKTCMQLYCFQKKMT